MSDDSMLIRIVGSSEVILKSVSFVRMKAMENKEEDEDNRE